jgi:hypothetical protein
MKRPQDSINILPLVQAAVGHTDPWEAAYLRFETPEQEISKFSKRLIKMGALDWSKDAKIVELFCGRGNGLHALSKQCLCEINRVLCADGLLVVVEPWLTPFLSLVHWLCRQSIARRLSGKIDALATMINHDRQSYERWLDFPEIILGLLHKYFSSEKCSCRWGKLWFIGRNRAFS